MRTVVAFAAQGTGVTVALDGAPGRVAGLGDSVVVDLTTASGDDPMTLGGALLTVLNSHPAVAARLLRMLESGPDDPPSPLYFDARAAAADLLPWEVIYVPPVGFCALDRRWPIGRIASGRRDLAVRLFTPPLRIVAVLSAQGRSGMSQLTALLKAVAAAPGGIGTRLHVIAGEDDVLAAAVGPGVTAERIAGTAPALERQIRGARPHLLHLLCHGTVAAGLRMLAFAHSADQVPGADPDLGGSLALPAVNLINAVLPGDPWLVVLSACETAAATGDGPVLANDIASGGVPAVIGMRRLVDIGEADRFCTELYPQIMDLVAATVQPGRACILDWAGALTAPRAVLGGPDPAATDSWTDPVLYAQDQPLQIVVMAPPAARQPPPPGPRPAPAPPPPPVPQPVVDYAEVQGAFDTWRTYLATLDPATADPAVIAGARRRVAQLEEILARVPR